MSPLKMQSLKSRGSFNELDLNDEIGKEAKAAIAHRRLSMSPKISSSPPKSSSPITTGGSSNSLEKVHESH